MKAKALILWLCFFGLIAGQGQVRAQVTGTWYLSAVQLPTGEVHWPDKRGTAWVEYRADGGLAGFDGCNKLGGFWKLENKEFVCTNVTSTKMACRLAPYIDVAKHTLWSNGRYWLKGDTLFRYLHPKQGKWKIILTGKKPKLGPLIPYPQPQKMKPAPVPPKIEEIPFDPDAEVEFEVLELRRSFFDLETDYFVLEGMPDSARLVKKKAEFTPRTITWDRSGNPYGFMPTELTVLPDRLWLKGPFEEGPIVARSFNRGVSLALPQTFNFQDQSFTLSLQPQPGEQWQLKLWEQPTLATALYIGKAKPVIPERTPSPRRYDAKDIRLMWMGDINRDNRPDWIFYVPEAEEKRFRTGDGPKMGMGWSYRTVLIMSKEAGYRVSANLGKVDHPTENVSIPAEWIKAHSDVKTYSLNGVYVDLLLDENGDVAGAFRSRNHEDPEAEKEALRLAGLLEFLPAIRNITPIPYPVTVGFFFPTHFPEDTPIAREMSKAASREYLDEAVDKVKGQIGEAGWKSWTTSWEDQVWNLGLSNYQGPLTKPARLGEEVIISTELGPVLHRFEFRFLLSAHNPLPDYPYSTVYSFWLGFPEIHEQPQPIGNHLPDLVNHPELKRFADPQVCLEAANRKNKEGWQSCSIEFNRKNSGRFCWRFSYTRFKGQGKRVLKDAWVDAHSGELLAYKITRKSGKRK